MDGGLRLQACHISAPRESLGRAVVAFGPTSSPTVAVCPLSGGKNTVMFGDGACGRLVGCRIGGAAEAGLLLLHQSTSPAVEGNHFSDCAMGICIWAQVDLTWALGQGNTFADMTHANVRDGGPGQPAAAAADAAPGNPE